MKSFDHPLGFDGITILELEPVDLRTQHPIIVAHAAFVSSLTGKTFGSTVCRQWSKETIEAFNQLLALMEQDVAELVAPRAAGDAPLTAQTRTPTGLGEALRSQEPPQI